jgi:hypothetical protein
MPFNVNEFRSQVNKYGLARDNLFLVTISGPALGAEFPEQDLRFFCRSVQVPGLQAQTLEYQNQGHGHQEKRVTNMSFDDLNLVFMVDSGYRIHQYFHRWMQAVVNYDNRDYGREYNGMLPFEVAYKDRIVGNVTVQAYGWHNREMSYEFKFEKAYPITLGTTDLAWENNDALLTLPVSFTFSTFIPTKGVGVSGPASPRPTSKTLGGGTSPNKVASGLNNIDGIFDVLGLDNPLQNVVDQFSTLSSSFNNLKNSANDFGNQLTSTIGRLT